MDWNKMGAISSLGSFFIAAIIFGVQIWPWPQLKGKGTVNFSAGNPKALAAFLVIGFLLSSISLYFAFNKPDLSSSYMSGELEVVRNQLFAGQTVELDGKQFENCTFDQAELVFHGTKHFNMINNRFKDMGSIKIRTDNPAAYNFLAFFIQFQEDNQWRLAFDLALVDSTGKSISRASFYPVGHLQVVPKP